MNGRESKPATGRSAAATQGLYRVAIVGAGTLKGKELAEILPETNIPTVDVKLLDDDESLGQLEAVGDEMTFFQTVTRDNFDSVDFAFFASEEKFTRRHWQMARQAGSAIIDLSYGLEGEAGSSVRAPWIDRELGEVQAPELQPAPVVVAHPAATVLGLLMLRAQKAVPVRTAVVTVFEPASERGRPGLDELHGQTVSILSFQQLPKDVFDVQVAFNAVSRYGEKAVASLESAERRMLDHFRRITRERVLVPSIMLLQAPIFHAYAFSLYLELEKPLALGDFTQALSGEHVSVTRTAEDAPSSVTAAGQDDILISLRRDPLRDHGVWIWAAADNLRVTALNAVACAEQLASSRPRGKVQ
ncbi:MAG TPA: Asd/ArgC dimerization domain-containing protein [Terriglobales bacterium]|nr:Asd/ArgC dimerization domain-containing protein [Terriglobales bacterium]